MIFKQRKTDNMSANLFVDKTANSNTNFHTVVNSIEIEMDITHSRCYR